MIVLDIDKSNILREKYTESFVNTNSDYYINKIKTLRNFSDGLCYEGYLWDCFNKPNIVLENEITLFLKDKRNIYIMCDIHSADRIFIPNYWKYPKSNVLFTELWSSELKNELPEDIYIYDDSFTWSVIYTHETDEHENRYCIFLKN